MRHFYNQWRLKDNFSADVNALKKAHGEKTITAKHLVWNDWKWHATGYLGNEWGDDRADPSNAAARPQSDCPDVGRVDLNRKSKRASKEMRVRLK